MRMESSVLVNKYQDKLFATAYSICKNAQDAEDAVQESFISYHSSIKEFESEDHIKAWLLRVAINKAKNLCRSPWRRINVPLDDYAETLQFECGEDKTLFESEKISLLFDDTPEGVEDALSEPLELPKKKNSQKILLLT